MARGSWRLTKPLQTPNTDEYSLGDSAPGANVRTQEGNNPDRQLRSQSVIKCKTKWEGTDSQEVGLEAAIL